MKLFVVRYLLLIGILFSAKAGVVVDSVIATFVFDLIACILVIVFGQTMINEE